MSTPTMPTYVRQRAERRELQMQTAFPAKVVSWSPNDNTVRIEPQFLETWFAPSGEIRQESTENVIDSVPVLFPRSGQFSITFPIESGSFGLVTCTKYSLNRWRQAGSRTDPQDLRRFTMAGAVFHPVNLVPESAELSGVDPVAMVLGRQGASDFVALAQKVDAALTLIKTHTHETQSGGKAAPSAELNGMSTATGSASVKASV